MSEQEPKHRLKEARVTLECDCGRKFHSLITSAAVDAWTRHIRRAEMASVRLPVHMMLDHTGNIYRVTYDGNLPIDAIDFPARLTINQAISTNPEGDDSDQPVRPPRPAALRLRGPRRLHDRIWGEGSRDRK